MSNKSQVNILIIDDHAMFRAGLRALINVSFPSVTVMEAGALGEALQSCMEPPAVILLDIRLPGLNGVDGMALLKRRWPDVPVIMLSAQDDGKTMQAALASGAMSFVSKAETGERIIEVLGDVMGQGCGTTFLPASTSPTLLTPRQSEVLELLCQGLSNKSIARRLDLSENTVRWHVQAILQVLKVSSRSEAAYTARSLGLIG